MGKRKELGLDEKVSLVEECLTGAAADAGSGTAGWCRTLNHGELDQPVPLRRISALEENGNQSKRRYDEDFKRKVVKAYVSGQGSSMAIAEKYHLRSGNLVLDWVKAYHERNSKKRRGFCHEKEHTVEERLQVVLSCLGGGQQLGDVAQAYQVEKATLRSWVKKYREFGAAGLEDRRGHRLAIRHPGAGMRPAD